MLATVAPGAGQMGPGFVSVEAALPVEAPTQWTTCRYAVGDVLWIREAWAYFGGNEYLYQQEPSQVMYRASWDGDPRRPDWERMGNPVGESDRGHRWRPSIHMPRWAARIFLRVEAVRIEYLNAITLADVRAEGFPDAPNIMPRGLDAFAGLWDSLNGHKPGARWASNPFCWVVTFRRVTA